MLGWEGVKNMMRMHLKKIVLDGTTDLDLSIELNIFYNRFDDHDFSKEMSFLRMSSTQTTHIRCGRGDDDTFKHVYKNLKGAKLSVYFLSTSPSLLNASNPTF